MRSILTIVVVLMVLALGTSTAHAQMTRTFTLTCNNLPGVGALITSWEWITDMGVTVATEVTTSVDNPWACADGGLFTITLTQPAGSVDGFTAGVRYSLAFSNGAPGCTDVVSNFVKTGQPVHFHDRCNYNGSGAPNNAVAVAVLGR